MYFSKTPYGHRTSRKCYFLSLTSPVNHKATCLRHLVLSSTSTLFFFLLKTHLTRDPPEEFPKIQACQKDRICLDHKRNLQGHREYHRLDQTFYCQNQLLCFVQSVSTQSILPTTRKKIIVNMITAIIHNQTKFKPLSKLFAYQNHVTIGK